MHYRRGAAFANRCETARAGPYRLLSSTSAVSPMGPCLGDGRLHQLADRREEGGDDLIVCKLLFEACL